MGSFKSIWAGLSPVERSFHLEAATGEKRTGGGAYKKEQLAAIEKALQEEPGLLKKATALGKRPAAPTKTVSGMYDMCIIRLYASPEPARAQRLTAALQQCARHLLLLRAAAACA